MCNLEDCVLVEVGIGDRVYIPVTIENYVVNDDRDAEEAAIENDIHLKEVAFENRVPVKTNSVDYNLALNSPMIIPPSHFGPGEVVVVNFQCGSKSKLNVGLVLAVDVELLQIKVL